MNRRSTLRRGMLTMYIVAVIAMAGYAVSHFASRPSCTEVMCGQDELLE